MMVRSCMSPFLEQSRGTDLVPLSGSHHSGNGCGPTAATVDALGQRTTMGYDAAGRMTTQQNPRGQIQTLSYDAMDRTTGWQVQGGALVTIGYDARSLTTLLMDGIGATTSTYDARGQMTLQQQPGGQNLTQTYDAVGNRTLLQYQEGTRFTYSYDARDQVTTLVRGAGTHVFGYDANGARTTWNSALGGVQTMAYDPRGYVTTISLTTPDSQALVIGNTYDEAGRKTVRTEGGVPFTYSYDAGDRLTGQASAGAAATFTYDTNTHLSLMHHQGQNPVTMTRNTLGQLTSRVQGGTTTDNDFDASGNIFEIEVGGNKVEQIWDPLDRLVTEDFRGGDVWEYAYGADDLRRAITKNSAVQDRVVWLDGMPLAIHGSSWSTLKQLYTVLGSETLGTDEREFYGDELGHVMAWYDETQAGSTLNSYWPYGELRSGSLPDDGLGYMGTLGVFTRASDDRIYARRRFLDAENGSWISLDPLYPEELGYQYGAARPGQRTDSLGLMAIMPSLLRQVPPTRSNPCRSESNPHLDARVRDINKNHSSVLTIHKLESIAMSLDCCQAVNKASIGKNFWADFAHVMDPQKNFRFMAAVIWCASCVETGGFDESACHSYHKDPGKNPELVAAGMIGFLGSFPHEVAGTTNSKAAGLSKYQQLVLFLRVFCDQACRQTPGCRCKGIKGGEIGWGPKHGSLGWPRQERWPYLPVRAPRQNDDWFKQCMASHGFTWPGKTTRPPWAP